MDRWLEQVCVVTGASAGIGAATCIALADAGLRVVGLARRSELVDKLRTSVQGKGTITSRKCDVSSSEDIAAAFQWIEETVGPVAVLVNNAGVLHEGLITDVGGKSLSEDALMSMVDVNLKGPIICSKLAVSCMKRHGIDGHILTVNSTTGHYVPLVPFVSVYSITKHGITAFHQALASELAHYNSKIKTTSLSPGLVATNLAGSIIDGTRPALQPQDVADAVLYALSTPPHVNITELTIEPVAEIRI